MPSANVLRAASAGLPVGLQEDHSRSSCRTSGPSISSRTSPSTHRPNRVDHSVPHEAPPLRSNHGTYCQPTATRLYARAIPEDASPDHPSEDLHDTPQPFTGERSEDDMHFLERCIQSRIRSHSFGGSLSFSIRPTRGTAFVATAIADTVDHNDRPNALSPQSTSNISFLEHAKWLTSIHHRLSEIASVGPPALDHWVTEALTLISQEWARLQLHKEREWLRQAATAAVHEQAGVVSVDSGKSKSLLRLHRTILIKIQSDISSNPNTSRTPSFWFTT